MVRHRLVWSLSAIAAAAALGAPAAHAGAPAVVCGQTITRSVTLHADLGCTGADPALTIGANGITLNLNGYTVSDGATETLAPLILDQGYHSVTIENGTAFPIESPVGIGLVDANDVRIVDMVSSSQDWGLTISGGRGDVIKHSTLEGHLGVEVSGSDDPHFVNDTVKAFATDTRIELSNVHDGVLTDDLIQGGSGISVGGSGNRIVNDVATGVEVTDGSNNVIEDFNTGVVTPGPLTIDAAATGTVVRANILNDGVIDVGSATTIVRNTVERGMNVSGAEAQIVRNTTDDNSGNGIDVSGADARIVDNIASGNGEDGIEVTGSGAHLSGNTTDDNSANGIEVTDPTAKIVRNTADDNTLYGILATPGDIGSANMANGNNTVNGVPGQQCLNISCEASS